MLETCTTSAIVLNTLLSAGSTIPTWALAAASALRIITLVQLKGNDGGLVDLANDACGLVFALVEYQKVMNNGQGTPDRHIQGVAEDLISIENFTKKKLKKNFLRRVLSRNKDVAEIARYREMLRLSLNTYGLVQSNISIQEYLHQLVDQIQQRTEMAVERQQGVEEERSANKEEQASQAPVHRMRDEGSIARLANSAILAEPAEFIKGERAREDIKCTPETVRLKQSQTDELRGIQEVNARLEHGREVLRQSVGGKSSPRPQTNVSPTSFSGPVYDSYPCSAHLLAPLQPFYPQPQAVISLQNVSGANISINSLPPVIHNINSGNIASVSLSNINNNETKSRRKRQA